MYLVYILYLPEKFAYVGVTQNIRKRLTAHLSDKKGIVYRHMKSHGVEPHQVSIHQYCACSSRVELTKAEYEAINNTVQAGFMVLNKTKLPIGVNVPKYASQEPDPLTSTLKQKDETISLLKKSLSDKEEIIQLQREQINQLLLNKTA